MPRWNIQYVYMDEDGKTRISVTQVAAATEDEARRMATQTAPAKKFVITIQEETEEQVLGTVRRDAMRLAGRARSEFDDTADEKQDGEGSGGGE